MFDNIKNIFKKDSYSLKQYLTKDESGITLLERLLKDSVELDSKEENKLKNSIEACYLYVKYDKDINKFELTEEQLFTKIEDKLLIEHIIDSFSLDVYDIINSIKNNIDIVDIIIKKDKYLLSHLSEEIKAKLIEENDNYFLIEKYFNNSFVLSTLIMAYDDPMKLLDICKKKNKLNILKFCNVEALMTNLDSSKTLLEYLLSINIIPNMLENLPNNKDFIKFLVDKNLFRYIKIRDKDILNLALDNGKTLLELFIEKNILKSLGLVIKNEKTIETLYKYNKLDLINIIDCVLLNKECKDFNINSDTILINYLLSNNYKFNFFESNSQNEEDTKKVIKNLYERKKLSIIGKSLNGKHLFYEVEKGFFLLEKLLDENVDINFGPCEIESMILAKMIFNKNRIDLLVKVNLDLLMKLSNDNKFYLEYVLEAIKNKKIKFNLNDFPFYKYSINTLAKFYLYVAKYDMINYLNEFSDKDLLRMENGKNLLDRLLAYDKNLTLNKVLTEDIKSNLKVSTYLKSKGINLENVGVDVPVMGTNVISLYLKEENDKKAIAPFL